MTRAQLSNLDIVSNKDGVWLYVSNLFYPLHELRSGTKERRGRASIPLAGAKLLTSLQDSGSLWEINSHFCTPEEILDPEPIVFTHGHSHTGRLIVEEVAL